MVSTGATSVSHAASVYHPHLLPPSSVAYPGISPIRLAEASPPPHSMPIEQSQYHRRCERVSPIRFKLTGAALHLGVTAATHVRRAAKLKTLCIMLSMQLCVFWIGQPLRERSNEGTGAT